MAEQATKGLPRFELRHRLSLALEWAEVTPAEMADELGVSETTVRNYRSGRTVPTRGTLRVWAMRCGVPLEWLQTGEVNLTDPETDPTQGIRPSGWNVIAADFGPRGTGPSDIGLVGAAA